MSPLQLQILLHYYCCANDFQDGDMRATAIHEAVDWFMSEGLLEVAPKQMEASYLLTDRGAVFVDALKLTPLPIQKWVMP